MVVAEAHGGLGLQGLLGFLVGHHIEAKEEQDEGGVWSDRDQSDAGHQEALEPQW